ncbi:hypothetical protein MOQ72_26985 [Saccharopolyspora sp. K220]|uniref:hypothetical protein n=1 Tax=Saccharopolyspora soli TaxID=2926618 RepID=UPI001F57F959|nr:hypothetical protein [Saccharopolyspora soli]MCI2421094.1 hypothetical protein [Saccharopolyspora soli]
MCTCCGRWPSGAHRRGTIEPTPAPETLVDGLRAARAHALSDALFVHTCFSDHQSDTVRAAAAQAVLEARERLEIDGEFSRITQRIIALIAAHDRWAAR